MSEIQSPYSVAILTPEETAAAFKFLGKEIPKHHTKVFVGSGLALEGSFALTCRDIESNEVAWQCEQKNLICDSGRRFFAYNNFWSVYVGFSPSKETPSPYRNSLATDPSQTFDSGAVGPTYNPVTYTKQWGVINFSSPPASNRTLGTICVMRSSVSIHSGNPYLAAYATLSPARVQTTTQTLEVIYKISMTPIS